MDPFRIQHAAENMAAFRLLKATLFVGVVSCAAVQVVRASEPFDASQIKAAERRVISALTAPDVTAWVSGRGSDATTTTRVRQGLVWRRESDGVWRIALEAFLPLEPGK